MATVQEVYEGARREAKRNGLRVGGLPMRAHAWATAVLRYLGFGEASRPDIVSGYRPPMEQRRLLDLWQDGRRSGLDAKPACRSWHMARRAIDVETNVRAFALYRDLLVQRTGARWGGQFSTPDPPHFDWPTGEPPPSIC